MNPDLDVVKDLVKIRFIISIERRGMMVKEWNKVNRIIVSKLINLYSTLPWFLKRNMHG